MQQQQLAAIEIDRDPFTERAYITNIQSLLRQGPIQPILNQYSKIRLCRTDAFLNLSLRLNGLSIQL